MLAKFIIICMEEDMKSPLELYTLKIMMMTFHLEYEKDKGV